MGYIINQNVEKFLILNIFCLLFFLRDIHEGQLSLEDTDEKQSNFASKLQNLSKSKKAIEKEFLKITLDYYLVQEKKFLITLKADYFQ